VGSAKSIACVVVGVASYSGKVDKVVVVVVVV
jgi:hypothetical protein